MITTKHTEDFYTIEHGFQHLLTQAKLSETGRVNTRLFGSTFVVEESRKIDTIEAAQRYVDKLTALPYIQKNYPRMMGLKVEINKRRSTYHVYNPAGHKIEFIDFHNSDMNIEYVLLHECAHAAGFVMGEDVHGPTFINTLLDLVSIGMSDNHAYVLRGMVLEAGLSLN